MYIEIATNSFQVDQIPLTELNSGGRSGRLVRTKYTAASNILLYLQQFSKFSIE